jgi:hypothetical protein
MELALSEGYYMYSTFISTRRTDTVRFYPHKERFSPKERFCVDRGSMWDTIFCVDGCASSNFKSAIDIFFQSFILS